MSKVIVGINIDNTVKLPNKGTIDVEVTSIKALDLDTMELVDIGIDNCEDVIGIKVDKDFDNTFTISVGRKGTRVHASSRSILDYSGTHYVAVFSEDGILAGGDSHIYIDFARSLKVKYNLSNSTYTIKYNTDCLYDCYENSNAKIGYESVEIYRNLYDTSINDVGIFNKINDYEYNLFDIAYIITKLHNDVIVSNGIKILVIDLWKACGEHNIVIPPSVEAVYLNNSINRYTVFYKDVNNGIITFNVAKSERDKIVSCMMNELRFRDNKHLDDYSILGLFDLKVRCY
jgi:hypothetical protein